MHMVKENTSKIDSSNFGPQSESTRWGKKNLHTLLPLPGNWVKGEYTHIYILETRKTP